MYWYLHDLSINALHVLARHCVMRQARNDSLCLASQITLLAIDLLESLNTSPSELFWMSIYTTKQSNRCFSINVWYAKLWNSGQQPVHTYTRFQAKMSKWGCISCGWYAIGTDIVESVLFSEGASSRFLVLSRFDVSTCQPLLQSMRCRMEANTSGRGTRVSY